MRNLLFPVLLLVGFSTHLPAQSADETAIKELIQAETLAFTKEAFSEVVKKYWILDDKTFSCVTLVDGVTLLLKTEDMLAETSVPPESHATFQKTEYQVSVTGNIAYVYHHQTVKLTDSGDVINSHEVRFLEKINGQWKIHSASIHQYK
jgi:TolB protein